MPTPIKRRLNATHKVVIIPLGKGGKQKGKSRSISLITGLSTSQLYEKINTMWGMIEDDDLD